ncbi:rubredoxin-like domain-containing protein [Geopsychrobacter electrodiphilus]|uniref:rubredoxin-like domain-containing protein n=1 Tax=Geopsychrobacter electrodiphilus TaxID=225196 RepID=UPI0003660534|nr:hypothetical protein [Geopsychrobacter electrodiphilus]
MQKRWRCTVCGYVHQGDEPPDICPVCGVGSEKFELLVEQSDDKSAPSGIKGLLREMIDTFMPHAVAAHFPNALVPTLGLFLMLCLLVGLKTLDHGIYLLLAMIAVSVPATVATGIYSWRHHYNGARSQIFHRKLILGGCLILICLEMLFMRYTNPELLIAPGGATWFFLALAAAALLCVTMLGHYGGMLVFGRIEKTPGKFD